MVAIGLVVVAWSVRAVGGQSIEAPTALVTTGPYRYSRNPMYVGWSAGYLGVAALAHSAWLLALFPVVAAVNHHEIRREERALEREFGAEYRRYRGAVRRYL